MKSAYELNWGRITMWPYILGIVFIIACLLAYLFKAGVLGKAKVKLGATPFILELDMQSNKRQISEKEFNLVNLNESYADSDLGFVIRKPLSKEWTMKKVTLREMFKEKGFTEEVIENVFKQMSVVAIKDPNKNVPVLVARRGEAEFIRYREDTTVNGRKVVVELIKSVLSGAEEIAYDQVAIFANKKDSMIGESSLLDFFLAESEILRWLGPKRLYVNPENTLFLLDCSALFKRIEYNGEIGDHIINNMGLFQENNQCFFHVTLSYVQSADKPPKVWDEIRDYLASFRVLVK